MAGETGENLANLILEFEDNNGRRWIAAAFLGTLREMDPLTGNGRRDRAAHHCSVGHMEERLPGLRVMSFKVVKYD